MESIISSLLTHAESQPAALALLDRNGGITYGDLWRRVQSSVVLLHRFGIRAGDTVALTLDAAPANSLRSLYLYYALAYLGAVILPIHSDVPTAARMGVVRQFGARHWIYGLEGRPATDTDLSLLDPAVFAAERATPVDLPPRGDEPNRPFLYVFTSGTTGAAKTVLYSVAQFFGYSFGHCNPLGLTSNDRLLSALPWPSKIGMRELFRIHRYGGAIVNEVFPRSRQELARLILDQGVTHLISSPVQVRLLLRSASPQEMPLPAVRMLTIGGAPIFPHEIRACRQVLTPNAYVAYGACEAGLIALLPPHELDNTVGKVGKPVPPGQAEVVDDKDDPVVPGTVGNLRLRVPWLAHGYVENAQATAQHFRDGWFYPGDLASIAPDGAIVLGGRNDDIINYGGVKVPPNQIEPTLREHPDVADAVVVGVPHETLGHVPIAFVVLRRAAAIHELSQFYADRIDGKLLPADYVSIQEIPRNSSGKVLYQRLRNDYLKSKIQQTTRIA